MLLPCRLLECFKQEQQKYEGRLLEYFDWIHRMYIGLQETLEDIQRLPLSEQASMHVMLLHFCCCVCMCSQLCMPCSALVLLCHCACCWLVRANHLSSDMTCKVTADCLKQLSVAAGK